VALSGAELARAESTVAAASAALAGILVDRFGTGARIVGSTFLHHEDHPVVATLALSGAPVGTAVAKFAVRDADGRIDDDSEAAWQLANEWATLQFLTDIESERADRVSLPVPEFYGADQTAGVVVMSDLGPGDSLAEVLLRGEGGGRRGAAEDRLGAWVDSVAAIHLATFGRTDGYRALRAGLGRLAGADPLQDANMSGAWLELSDTLGVGHASEVTDELGLITSLVDEPGDWDIVSLKDLCPDNNRVHADGSVSLFDAQYSGCQHALIDVAYLHATMPTCWCVRRLPDGLADRLVARYVDALTAGGRDVGADFDVQLAVCRAYLALWRGAGAARHAVLDDGDRRPYWDTFDFTFPSHRQQLALRCEQVAQAAALHPRLDAVADWSTRLSTAIRSAWPASDPLPLYPAFSSQADSRILGGDRFGP